MQDFAAANPTLVLKNLEPGMAKYQVAELLENWTDLDIYRAIQGTGGISTLEERVRRAGAINSKRAISGIAAKMFVNRPELLKANTTEAHEEFRKHLNEVINILTKPVQLTVVEPVVDNDGLPKQLSPKEQEARAAEQENAIKPLVKPVDEYLERNGFKFVEDNKPVSFFGRPEVLSNHMRNIWALHNYLADSQVKPSYQTHLEIFADWACNNLKKC